MARSTTIWQPNDEEQKLMRIIRELSPARLAQVIDFAQFLAMRKSAEDELEEEDSSAANARWDALFATEESQRLLERMADDALAEIRAGRARPMAFDENGEIIPG